jgi:Zn-dependent protease with chaperone function
MLLLILVANVTQLHGVAERLAWCNGLVDDHRETFTPVGFGALAASLVVSASALRVRRRQRRQPTPHDERELAIVASDEPVAYTLPGQPGQVVVSTAMLQSLDRQERRVLLAHERSHLRRGHHRYIRATELAVAALPFLAPLNARLRFVLERWADEDAAAEVGDRALVASAIARAALATHGAPEAALAMADAGVVERVEIMLAGSPRESRVIERLLSGVVLAGAFGLLASLLLVGPWFLALVGFCG